MSWLEELVDKTEAIKDLPEPRCISLSTVVFLWEPWAGKVTALEYYPKTLGGFYDLAGFGEPRLFIYESLCSRLMVKVSERLFLDAFSNDKGLADDLVVWAVGADVPVIDLREEDGDLR